MKRILGLVLVLLALAVPARAQTATWIQQNVASTTQAAGFTYRLYTTPSGATTANPPVTLTGMTCTGTIPDVTCTAPVGPAVATAAKVPGAKTVLTAQDTVSGTPESAPSLPFLAGAAVPTALSIK